MLLYDVNIDPKQYFKESELNEIKNFVYNSDSLLLQQRIDEINKQIMQVMKARNDTKDNLADI
jgi:hypothetical protein